MIAVVTGASGFIGSNLVEALVARGATVRTLARAGSPTLPADARVRSWTVDLLDHRSVREAGAWEGATHLFHLAGVTKRRTAAQFRHGNIVPTANVLAAAVARGGSAPPRTIVLSSQAAAGPAPAPDRPVREEDPPRPIEAYGRSKLEAERAVQHYSEQLEATVLRPAAVYGPRDRDFLAAFRQATRRLAFHAAPAENLISVVYVADLVSAILLAAERREAVGRTYFVANEQPVSWRALYHEIAAAAGTTRGLELQVPRALLSAAGMAGDLFGALTGLYTLANRNKTLLSRPPWWLCDAARIRGELGWSEDVPLQRGLRETYLWYLEAGWLRPPRPRTASAPSEEPPA